jgi:hypothetical protein
MMSFTGDLAMGWEEEGGKFCRDRAILSENFREQIVL